MVRSAGTSGGPSKKKKRPLPARSNAASSLEESRQRYKVSTFGSSGPRTNSGLCRGLKSLHMSAHIGTYQHMSACPNVLTHTSMQDKVHMVGIKGAESGFTCWHMSAHISTGRHVHRY